MSLLFLFLSDRAKLMPTLIQWCFQSNNKKEKTMAYEMKGPKEQKEMEAMGQENKERKPPSKVHDLCCEYDNWCVTYLCKCNQ